MEISSIEVFNKTTTRPTLDWSTGHSAEVAKAGLEHRPLSRSGQSWNTGGGSYSWSTWPLSTGGPVGRLCVISRFFIGSFSVLAIPHLALKLHDLQAVIKKLYCFLTLLTVVIQSSKTALN